MSQCLYIHLLTLFLKGIPNYYSVICILTVRSGILPLAYIQNPLYYAITLIILLLSGRRSDAKQTIPRHMAVTKSVLALSHLVPHQKRNQADVCLSWRDWKVSMHLSAIPKDLITERPCIVADSCEYMGLLPEKEIIEFKPRL